MFEKKAVTVNVDEFCSALGLEILHRGSVNELKFTTYNINRPGLQLAGFYEHFGFERVQVMGEMEMTYLRSFDDGIRQIACDKLFAYDFPCLVISHNIDPCAEIIHSAKRFDKVLLKAKQSTTLTMNALSYYLNEVLAPEITIHGVLVDLYGVGVLIVGDSSIGKSETALELVQRNHRLVSDDAVCIKLIDDTLIGSAPPIIQYFMEVRGVGIIDIRSLYGSGAVKSSQVIELVVQLETWDNSKTYDRLGSTTEYYELLGKMLPKHTVPVKPGRNLAVILEVAARNYRLKSMGYDTLKELDARMKKG